MSPTKRQLEVLRWIVEGKSNGQIAEILGISRNTVAVHRACMMKKMGVHKTAELVLYAIRHSLVRLPFLDSERAVDSVPAPKKSGVSWLQSRMTGKAPAIADGRPTTHQNGIKVVD